MKGSATAAYSKSSACKPAKWLGVLINNSNLDSSNKQNPKFASAYWIKYKTITHFCSPFWLEKFCVKPLFLFFKALFSILHYTIMYFTILHFTILHLLIVHFTRVHFIIVHYTTLHIKILHFEILHFTILHFTILHFTTLHFTILHFTILQITIFLYCKLGFSF